MSGFHCIFSVSIRFISSSDYEDSQLLSSFLSRFHAALSLPFPRLSPVKTANTSESSEYKNDPSLFAQSYGAGPRGRFCKKTLLPFVSFSVSRCRRTLQIRCKRRGLSEKLYLTPIHNRCALPGLSQSFRAAVESLLRRVRERRRSYAANCRCHDSIPEGIRHRIRACRPE